MSLVFKTFLSFIYSAEMRTRLLFIGILWISLGSIICGASVPDAAKALRQAWDHYKQRDFTLATEEFHALQAASPAGSEFYLQGLYGEACCWAYRQDGRDVEKAKRSYEALLQQASPKNSLVPWAALDLVRLYNTSLDDVRPDYSDLAVRYGQVYQLYPGTAASMEARLYQLNLELLALKTDPNQIIGATEEFIQTHPQGPYLSSFYKLLATCYGQLDQRDQQVAALVQSLNTREQDPDNPSVDNAGLYWQIANRAQYETGDFALARTYYRRLLTEYPRDIRVFGANKELSQMDEIEADIRAGRAVPSQWLPEEKR